MKCENLKYGLSLYADDVLSAEERAAVEEHLEHCPLCRQRRDDLQVLRQGLRASFRPQPPGALVTSVKRAVAAEIAAGLPHKRPFISASVFELLQMRVMPFGVGAVASLVFGISLLWTLLSSANLPQQTNELARTTVEPSTVFLSSPLLPRSDEDVVNAADFAAERIMVSGESPSLNPQGALVALAESLVGGRFRGNEVVIVADVLSNGGADIEEIVEPLDNEQAVYELERALNKDTVNTPFVPAFLDKRADEVRVVFKIQRVDVRTTNRERTRKRN